VAISLFGALGGILAARLLGPEGRGELAAAVAWGGMFTVIMSLGMPQALTFFVARDVKTIGSVFRAALLIWLFQSIIMIGIGWIVVGGILAQRQPIVGDTVRGYLLSIPFSMLVTYLSTMAQGLKQFVLFNGLRIFNSIAYLVSLILATIFRFEHALEVVSLLLLMQILITLLCFLCFVLLLRPQGSLSLPSCITSILSYGVKSYWGSLAWMLNGRLDQLVMSMFVPLEMLGYYSVAVSYGTFLFPVAGVFAITLFPEVAGTTKTDKAKHKIVRALRLNLLISGFGALSCGLAAPWMLPTLFGYQFGNSVYSALVLLIGTVLLGCNYVLSDGLRGLGDPMGPSYAEFVGVGVTLLGLLLLLPTLGILGAAISSVLSYMSVFALLVSRLKLFVPAR